MPRKPSKAKPKNNSKSHHDKMVSDFFLELMGLITEYGECCRADEMKGGGDPADMESIELHLLLSKSKIDAQFTKMQRYFE